MEQESQRPRGLVRRWLDDGRVDRRSSSTSVRRLSRRIFASSDVTLKSDVRRLSRRIFASSDVTLKSGISGLRA